MSRRPAFLCPVLLIALAPTSARAVDLDIDAMLADASVELLAITVEPSPSPKRWDELREQHRAHGLKVVAIVAADREGRCPLVAFTADHVLCDVGGRIAKQLNVARAPAAFLWSWRGERLVDRAGVEEVAAASERFVRERLRVDVAIDTVEDGAKITALSLRSLLRGRLRSERKLAVIAAADEHAKLVELQRRSFEVRYDDAQQAQLGRETAANALLQAAIRDALPRDLLELQLISIESSNVIAASTVEWTPLASSEAVDRAVSLLVAQLAKPRPSDIAANDEEEKREDEVDVAALLAEPHTRLLAVLPPGETIDTRAPGLVIVEDFFAEGASLWSWRGDLLVDRGTCAEVEAAIDRELASTVRVHLSIKPAGLKDEVQKKLVESHRFEVEGEGAAALGRAQPANALFELTADPPSFHLELLSLDRAEVLGSVAAKAKNATAAIDALFAVMTKPIEKPPLSPHAAEIEVAWKELHPLVIDRAIARDRRVSLLLGFLRDHPNPNHRRQQAELILKAIQESP